MKLSLIIPLHNEEDNIVFLIDLVPKALGLIKAIEDYEIIFVNDGSTDRTKEFLGHKLPDKCRFLNLKHRYGQTAAIKAGLDAASFEVAGVMDGDLQVDAREFEKLILEFLFVCCPAYHKNNTKIHQDFYPALQH